MSAKLIYALAENPPYVFCEHISNPPKGNWHIRKFDGNWKLGGACSPPLCWYERLYRWTGWDLQVRILESHYGHTCPQCLELFLKADEDIDV